ncbi:cytochrome P450 6j1-like isoform X2 [Bacillus rossius redtenbacheri]|uniref:cytochrome P450 6j1-like isoform X2 n=1 Tax=Bacillus rossius redtenbacheri TaxID=93214 RepID=UPI002FDE7033
MDTILSAIVYYTTAAFAGIFAVLYLYFWNAFRHWKTRGVHYAEPSLFVGNLGGVFSRREGLVDLFRRLYREAAGHRVVGMFLLGKPVLVLRDLDLVRRVLTKDAHAFLNRFFMPPEKFDPLFAKSLVAAKGKKWKHLRIKMTPTFTSGKIRRMLQLVEDCSKKLVRHIDQEVSEGRPVVVKDAMARYTMDAIASCSFGINANALENPDCEFISKMKMLLEPKGLQMLLGAIIIFTPWLQKFVHAKAFDVGVTDFVRRTFWDMVDHRKASGIVRKDFVDLLMQLRQDGEVRAEDEKDQEEIKQDSRYMNVEVSRTDGSDVTLDEDDIVAQAFIFIFAGYETSSSVLTFTLYELALNPPVQDRLRREMEDVLEKHGSKVTYVALAEMSYLDMVVAESLRKYSPLSFIDRECLSDYTIEGTDITLKKGTVVIVPSHGIHYDPDIYPDPEKFDPERFSDENKGKRSNFAHLPFGEGPRKCIETIYHSQEIYCKLKNCRASGLITVCGSSVSSEHKSSFHVADKKMLSITWFLDRY